MATTSLASQPRHLIVSDHFRKLGDEHHGRGPGSHIQQHLFFHGVCLLSHIHWVRASGLRPAASCAASSSTISAAFSTAAATGGLSSMADSGLPFLGGLPRLAAHDQDLGRQRSQPARQPEDGKRVHAVGIGVPASRHPPVRFDDAYGPGKPATGNSIHQDGGVVSSAPGHRPGPCPGCRSPPPPLLPAVTVRTAVAPRRPRTRHRRGRRCRFRPPGPAAAASISPVPQPVPARKEQRRSGEPGDVPLPGLDRDHPR